VTLVLSGSALAAPGQQISVNGTGAGTVPDGATNAQQQAVYDQAVSAAITDAQTKARAVAQQLSLTLGPVQTFTEQSVDYLGYCGVGFLPTPGATGVSGSATAPTTATAPTGRLTPIPAKRTKRRHKRTAKKAQSSETTCQLQANVTLVYSAS
jgi:uncharacterized protein YggE